MSKKQGSVTVQSLLFSKKAGYSRTTAKKWAHSHGFKATRGRSPTNWIRLRQFPAEACTKDSIRTIRFKNGLLATVCVPKRGR